MSIFSAPSFYAAPDRQTYSAGNYFIPQEKYTFGGVPRYLMPSGITATTAANAIPPILPINQGGGGDGGGGGIDTSAPEDQSTTADDFGYGLEGIDPSMNMTEEEKDAIDAYNNPGLNAIDYGTLAGVVSGFTNPITGILGLVFNKNRKQKAAMEKAQTAAAIADDARSTSAETHGGYGTSEGGIGASGPGSGGGYNEGNFCFDPNTLVQMADGSEKKIKEIQLGDQTKGGEVTGVFQFKASDEIHDYKGVTVAGSHYVKENGRFIMVQDSPISVKIDKIPVVYSLDTTGRRIFIKDIEFADYNGDGIAKGFLANAGVDLGGRRIVKKRQVENRLI